jgi:hypothetical protein
VWGRGDDGGLKTGEVIPVARDVATEHPDWVHQQCGYEPDCGVSREVALQGMLDQISYEDYRGKGRDNCGLGVEFED